jgi:hypothetical protein
MKYRTTWQHYPINLLLDLVGNIGSFAKFGHGMREVTVAVRAREKTLDRVSGRKILDESYRFAVKALSKEGFMTQEAGRTVV